MKIIKFYFTLSAIFLFSNAIAQDGQRPEFLDKIFVGGGFGASFGDYTYVNVAPIIGYKVTPKLSAGLRLMYQFRMFDYYIGYDKMNFKANDYGVGVFARLIIKGPVFLQTEYERLNYEYLNVFDNSSIRSSFDSFMAGGGIAQPIGGKAFLFFTVMYNFSIAGSDNAPYDSPLVTRVGISAGF